MKNSLEQKLREQANLGLFCLYASISKKHVAELRQRGFVVTDSHESNSFPRLHKICWRAAGASVFDYINIHTLDENNVKYTLAQRLWIISEKNQPSLKTLYG